MAYFILIKNAADQKNSLYRIAENNSDLNSLNIDKYCYNIIEVAQDVFNLVKFQLKHVRSYDNNNNITYKDMNVEFDNKQKLEAYIVNKKNTIKQFLDTNPNHSLFTRWNNYYNQLNSLNLDSITYPLIKSLEQYFNDLGQPSYNILQLP
jgi:hypothetical protein